MQRILLFGLSATALLVSSAWSQGIASYTAAFGSINASSGGTSTDFMLPRFDPALGQLVGVQLQLTGGVEQFARGENIGGSSPYAYNLTVSLEIWTEGGLQLFGLGPVINAESGNLASFDGAFDFGGASGFDSGLLVTQLSETFFSPLDSLQDFICESPLQLTAIAYGQSIVTASGNTILQSSNSMQGTLQAIYTYLPAAIPEASTSALWLGMSAVLVVTILRRRRAVFDSSSDASDTAELNKRVIPTLST